MVMRQFPDYFLHYLHLTKSSHALSISTRSRISMHWIAILLFQKTKLMPWTLNSSPLVCLDWAFITKTQISTNFQKPMKNHFKKEDRKNSLRVDSNSLCTVGCSCMLYNLSQCIYVLLLRITNGILLWYQHIVVANIFHSINLV